MMADFPVAHAVFFRTGEFIQPTVNFGEGIAQAISAFLAMIFEFHGVLLNAAT